MTVRVQVPAGAEFLVFRPWELAHVDGVPLAARGDVALVYDLAGASQAKAPLGAALRMLAVFSLPTARTALALRRERYELSRLVRRVATKSRRRVELQVAQYGVTREKLADLAESGDGWDVLHLSGHGAAGQFLLEKMDGSPDPVSAAELIGLLRPMRARVKLAVVSACESAAATTAETLRWLGLGDPAAELEAQAAQEAPATPEGVARALVAELGCAVVAMRYRVVDEFAIGFADALYDRLFRQGQILDRAVAAAVPAVIGPAPSSACPPLSVTTPALFGASAAGLVLTPPKSKPDLDPEGQVMAGFPPEPPRFVGRAEPMAAASAARGPGAADPTLGRRVLTLVQGHPKLLEFADAAAADPARLASQLAAAEAAVALTAFLSEGATALDATQFLQTLTAWTIEAAATLPAPSRLLLQALCQIEETDRDSTTLDGNWGDLWRHLEQPGDPPPLAEVVAPLVESALIAAEPADPPDPNTPVVYRIHPGIAEAIHTSTPQPVIVAVDAELAAWWTAVAYWEIEQERAGQDTGQFVVRAGLAAAPYLLRQHDWDTARSLLEEARLRDSYSPVTAQAVIPSLRRIAEATSGPQDLGMLAAALTTVDPGEAETLLRSVYDQATTRSDHSLASAAANDLANLLANQGRSREALTLIDETIEHARQAGLGSWTQLSNQGRQLQLLGLLGRHQQVLTDLPALWNRLAELPDQPAGDDPINPWNIREATLATGFNSTLALGRWRQALDLNNEVTNLQRRRGASTHETARTRFNNYGRRHHDARQGLFRPRRPERPAGPPPGRPRAGAHRAAPQIRQPRATLHRDAHHNLASCLFRATGTSAEQRAQHLAAALLHHLTGDTHTLTPALRALAYELLRDTDAPDAPVLPTTLSEVTRLVDAGDGVHFGNLIATLCPDPDTADQALADLLATATTLCE